jgi:undecaprenyl diphosphate synthase
MWHLHTQVNHFDEAVECRPVLIGGSVTYQHLCSARDEMAQAVQTVVSGVEDGTLEVSDVTQQLLSSCLYTSASPNPELLIRTSGEVRLSDYMLWQVGTGEWKDVQFELATHLKAKKFVF